MMAPRSWTIVAYAVLAWASVLILGVATYNALATLIGLVLR